MAGVNHLHSDEPQPNLRRRCSRQQLAKGAAGRRLAVDLGDEVAHAKPGGVASATLDHVGDLVVVGVDRDSKRPALAFERHCRAVEVRSEAEKYVGARSAHVCEFDGIALIARETDRSPRAVVPGGQLEQV